MDINEIKKLAGLNEAAGRFHVQVFVNGKLLLDGPATIEEAGEGETEFMVHHAPDSTYGPQGRDLIVQVPVDVTKGK